MLRLHNGTDRTMGIVTYGNLEAGFGVTYDDARITHADDADDPRLRASWRRRVPTQIAAAVLFTTPHATAPGIARGLAPSLLLTTDCFPLQTGRLARWDWAQEAKRRGRPFLAATGAHAVEAAGLYWRGFPVLQFTTVPAADAVPPPAAEPPAPVECLSLLHTPAQTFAIELVVPVHDLDEWSEPFQEVSDGFFLLPIAREGIMRTGHKRVWSLRLQAGEHDLTDGLAAR
jgi:hypothetical protein